MNTIRVLVVGCGNMGSSHARAYRSIEGFQVVGLCSRLSIAVTTPQVTGRPVSRPIAARPEIAASQM